MVIDEKLLNRAEKVVVIDHHRRGEEFINNTMLVYMEPYASSTAELVTELLEYQPKHDKISCLKQLRCLLELLLIRKALLFGQVHEHLRQPHIYGQMERTQC